ncbi:arylformamidase [Thermoactinomyces mirandus]|uniref:Kynurenine formamidase n=1 Tax=Thermoactinomyces mirandus TaxID=2756294 RepID=A0A7W2ARV8_9BACL|nr:arylformamidase [Thermoactinomyces mirandus]MBA4602812.1 arylformamidase [Thermoactinomyces mirandus]
MNWLDISMPLHDQIPVWPGDAPFLYRRTWTKAESGTANVGELHMSTHAGTHIDAPFHIDESGQKVHELDLDVYIGKARVIHLLGKKKITAGDLSRFDLGRESRLLIRTGSWVDRSQFPGKFCYLDADIAPFLQEREIRLVGLDVPSADSADSRELPVHHAFLKAGIHLLENAVLDKIEEGIYEMIALPLPIRGGDASPVRAVIRPAGHDS